MAGLPSGTVTFLFSDIEGSTRLLQALGDRFAEVLHRHGVVVHEAVRRAGGVEVSTEGDSFFVVFTSAPGAVRAAVEIQRGLASEPWPEEGAVRVRMGLHTGEGRLGGDNYVGLDVHRAARIAAAGHGGQVLLSQAVATLVEGGLPDGCRLRDLGPHQLKDLPRPEHLYQLEIGGLPNDFPPLRSLDVARHNLPSQLTSFVGREDELAEAVRLLRGTRLLSLTGPGGTGKTRLGLQVAAQAAEEFRDGVFFVPLASITDPQLVPSAIVTALGLTQLAGSPLDHLRQYLADKETLLVLDNFEQVVDAAPQLAELLRGAPRMKLLVTTRAGLHVSGEQEFAVPSLEVPDPSSPVTPEELATNEAVVLFVERASAVRPGFQVTPENARSLVEITARLDGLPLAIELAAARIKLLSPEEIAQRLNDRLGLLAGGARDLPRRQRTLRDAIAWSYDLLDGPPRRLLARLAVFRGGAALEQVEAVCGPSQELGMDVLEALDVLVDQSLLIQQEAGGRSRLLMLETIREFAWEQLAASGEAAEVAERHARAYLALADEAAGHLLSWQQVVWLDRLEEEQDNLRAALTWAVEERETDVALWLGSLLWRFWQIRGHLEEASQRLAEVLALPGGGARERAQALEAAGGVAYWQGAMERAADLYHANLRAMEELDDRAGVANALYNLSSVFTGGDPEQAARSALESLSIARELGDEDGIVKGLFGAGSVAWMAEDWDGARSYFQEALEMLRRLDDPFHLGWTLFMLGSAEIRAGRYDRGRPLLEEGLRIFQRLGDITGVLFHLHGFTVLALEDGQPERAVRLLGATARLRETSGAALVDKVSHETPGLQEALVSLGDERVRALMAEGAAMHPEQLVPYALADARSGDPVEVPPDRVHFSVR